MERIRSSLKFQGMIVVEPLGRSGGLALLWRENEQVNLLSLSQYHIDVELQLSNMQTWRVLEDIALQDLPLNGHQFTWERGRNTAAWIEIRLDRVVVSSSWLSIFPLAKLYTKEGSSSDHSPICLEPIVKQTWNGKKCFRFENAWLTKPLCYQIVKDKWEYDRAANITHKVQQCVEKLAVWGREITGCFKKQISSFLERAFVRLNAWFQWFNTTQSGKDESSYYWHGRDNTTIRQLNPQTLTSRFDDYPRASHPNDEERHVDLRCWMSLAADSLHSISDFLKIESVRGKEYKLMSKVFSDFELLNQMHFDKSFGAYFDFGNHTEKVRLSWKLVDGPNNILSRQLIREVLEEPILRFVPHIGYVSLFPFIWKIVPAVSCIKFTLINHIS
ncbi:uncharacterized protein LOC141680949 [Apium graveolens]|uniref:uncharacterized protein LOC141680949 n=1 Tax=Apium graveolens TaxID=4045 RepID=UPI003D7B7B6D